jgi:hypothetical protein
MMRYKQVLAVLEVLLEATKSKALTWEKSVEGVSDWYCTELAGRAICFRQLYFEATNQIGADPYMFDLHMPGLNDCFACGTEGYYLMLEILGAAFEEWRSDRDNEFALRFLRESLAGKLDDSAG